MMDLFLLSLLLFALHSCYSSSSASPLDVKLKTGNFQGVATSTGLEKWLGIPYAVPPVGFLRFKAPVPVTKASNSVRDASQFGNACPQPKGNWGAPISEDCLYLNVNCLLPVNQQV
jgi:carboxylesterase type B